MRKALGEREVLLKSAPHIMWPLRFVMPHDASMRPTWMIRAGLFLYDHLARREVLPASRAIDLRAHVAGAPLKPQFKRGFVYSDGWVDDARLVALCAVDAAAHGATVRTCCLVDDAVRGNDSWQVRLLQRSVGGEASADAASAAPIEVTARALVNAAGPWAARFLGEHAHATGHRHLRLVKGSHIVVKKLFEHDHAYIFQNADGRIIFAIPYEGDYTLIGTTDVEQHGPLGEARADASEIAYLCEQASRYFTKPVTPDRVVWTYSGVRPLLDDESGNPAAVTRDYRLELDSAGAPLLSVWGGKITTFRRLAEEAADMLVQPLDAGRAAGAGTGIAARAEVGDGSRVDAHLGPAWTAGAPLPGGDLRAWLGAEAPPADDVSATFERFVAALARKHTGIDGKLLRRLARAYGSRADGILAAGLGEAVAPQVHAGELAYLREQEWALSGEDVLWRRSKLGLHLDGEGRAAVTTWMARARQAHASLATTP